jgi:hypothetical protein
MDDPGRDVFGEGLESVVHLLVEVGEHVLTVRAKFAIQVSQLVEELMQQLARVIHGRGCGTGERPKLRFLEGA